jgi:signal transduction histidine kinase
VVDRLGLIVDADDAAVRLLKTGGATPAGRFLLAFIDPASQRDYLEESFLSRRRAGPLRFDLFLRPRRALPVRCSVTVSAAEPGSALRRWTFVPRRKTHGNRNPLAEASLAEASLAARETEARRIARDLHDEAGQMLAALHIEIDAIARTLPAPQAERVLALRQMVGSVEEQLRRLSHEILPPALEGRGLAAALETLAESVSARTAAVVTAATAGAPRVPPAESVHLYRIAQEAVSNAVRHGGARRIRIRLEKRGERVVLSVTDDGRGFDVRALAQDGGEGLGLASIRERSETLGATLAIQSAPGKGATVTVSIPS